MGFHYGNGGLGNEGDQRGCLCLVMLPTLQYNTKETYILCMVLVVDATWHASPTQTPLQSTPPPSSPEQDNVSFYTKKNLTSRMSTGCDQAFVGHVGPRPIHGSLSDHQIRLGLPPWKNGCSWSATMFWQVVRVKVVSTWILCACVRVCVCVCVCVFIYVFTHISSPKTNTDNPHCTCKIQDYDTHYLN